MCERRPIGIGIAKAVPAPSRAAGEATRFSCSWQSEQSSMWRATRLRSRGVIEPFQLPSNALSSVQWSRPVRATRSAPIDRRAVARALVRSL